MYCRLSLCCQSNSKEILQPCTVCTVEVTQTFYYRYVKGSLIDLLLLQNLLHLWQTSLTRFKPLYSIWQRPHKNSVEVKRPLKKGNGIEQGEHSLPEGWFFVWILYCLASPLLKNPTTLLQVDSGFEISPCKMFPLCNNNLLLPISNHE